MSYQSHNRNPDGEKSNIVFYIIIAILTILVIVGIGIGVWKYIENKKKEK